MKFFLNLSILTTFLLLSSCGNDGNPLLDSESDVNVESSLIQTRTANGLPVVMKGGALCFESVDIFTKTAEELSNMSDSLFEAWEKSMGFSSYRTKVNRLIEEADAIENDMVRHEFILAHSQFLKEEDGEATPIIGSQLYRTIVNEDGVFYVNQTKNVVSENTVTGYSNRTRSVQRTSYTENNSRTLISNLTYETREKKVSKRKVITSAKVVKYAAFDAPQARYTHGIEILVDGKKKGLAKWKHYTTDHYVKEVHIEFDWIPVGIDSNNNLIYGSYKEDYNSTVSSGNSHRLIKTYSAGYPSPYDINLYGVNVLTYKAYTQGTGEANYLFYAVLNGEIQP